MKRWMLTGAVVVFAALGAGAMAGGDEDDVEGGTIGTGIMGVVTGFGSIHIGGVRVETPEGMVVRSEIGDRTVADIAVGQTIVVEAREATGDLIAVSMRDYHPLVAPVDSMTSGSISVLGLSLDMPFDAGTGIAVGDWVAISGLWRGDTVEVSDIMPVPAQDRVLASGTFTLDDDGVQRIGPFALGGAKIAHAQVGDQLLVVGDRSADRLTILPQRVVKGLFPSDPKRLFIEGYMSQPDQNGTYFIHGSGVRFETDDPAMQVPDARSVFCVEGFGAATFRQIVPLDMAPDARQSLLERLAVEGAVLAGTSGCEQ